MGFNSPFKGLTIFHVFHSVRYSPVAVVEANRCTQLYQSYNNIIKATNSYMFQALLAAPPGKRHRTFGYAVNIVPEKRIYQTTRRHIPEDRNSL